MTLPDSFTEYVVAIRDTGYLSSRCFPLPSVHFSEEKAVVFVDRAEAFDNATRLGLDYRRYGASDMAAKVYVRARTATVSREDWREVRDDDSATLEPTDSTITNNRAAEDRVGESCAVAAEDGKRVAERAMKYGSELSGVQMLGLMETLSINRPWWKFWGK